MIKFEKLRVYDKRGSDIQWFPTSLISVSIESVSGKDAEIYPYLSHDNTIGGFYINNGGFGFGTYDSLSYVNGSVSKINGVKSNVTNCYIKHGNDIIGEVPIENIEFGALNYTDSFGEHKSLYIKDIKTDGVILYDVAFTDYNVSFPTLTFTGALYTDKISTGFVETEHLHFFYADGKDKVSNVYDDEDGILVLNMGVGDSEIKLFDIEDSVNSIIWCESVEHEIPKSKSHAYPISFNIGFKSEDEGVYENTLNLYYEIDDTMYQIAEIIINAESIGEDERYRTLLSNFGIPDPKNFSDILKDSNIKEALPDWMLINNKSKEMFLEYDNIFKYCGTYKGLVNAVKVLGYDDIYFREWFLDTKSSTRKTFRVAYGNKDISDTIKTIPFSERKTLKKLNSLSMIYQLNKETGDYDDAGVPIVENVYQNNIKEVRVKMLSLKDWLEKNIIGVNCRITDITAEGVYYDSYDNRINGTYNHSFEVNECVELTPYVKGDYDKPSSHMTSVVPMDEESNAILKLSVLEASKDYLTTKDIGKLSANDFGLGSAASPLHNITDFMWRVNIKTKSSILSDDFVTNYMWVYNNTIKLKTMLTNEMVDEDDSEGVFNLPYYDGEKWYGSKVNISLEQAYLRSDVDNEILFSVLPIKTVMEDCVVDKISVDVNSGAVSKYTDTVNKEKLEYGLFQYNGDEISELFRSNAYVSLRLNSDSRVVYKYNDITKSFSLFLYNFTIVDGDNNSYIFNDEGHAYVLEIIDGKIAFEPINNEKQDFLTTYVNFNYDKNIGQQTIECNHTYTSPRLSVMQNGTPSVDYDMVVNHIGDYQIELLTWNDYNIPFINESPYKCEVINNKPLFNTYLNVSSDDMSDDMINDEYIFPFIHDTPIYDAPLIYNIDSIIEDGNNYSVISESNSYMHKIPYIGSYVNVTDKYYNTYRYGSEFNIYSVINNYEYKENLYTLLLHNGREGDVVYTEGEVINIKITIHEKGDRDAVIFETSCTTRILDVVYNEEDREYEIYVKNDIFQPYILHYLNYTIDMCTISVQPAWCGINNIKTFRIEEGTEYELNGNKLKLDFTNDNYILPYIDKNFYLTIEDFDVAYVKSNWMPNTEIDNIVKVDNTFDIDNNGVILFPENLYGDNIYIWTVYTNDELIYRVYNTAPSFKYERGVTYNVYLEKIDSYGNISTNKHEGVIKIKETV